MKEACEILKTGKNSEEIEKNAKELLACIDIDFEIEFSVNNEKGILYYIAGFLSKAELKRISCASCKSLFVKSTDTPKIDLDEDLSDNREKLLEQINRGGLCTPSDSMYICVLYARQLYKKIFDKGDIEKKFLALENQRDVFSACLEMKLQHDSNIVDILDQTCHEKHKFSARMKSIGDRVFNTFSKNFAGELNDKIHADKKRIKSDNPKECSAAKKIKKLQSN